MAFSEEELAGMYVSLALDTVDFESGADKAREIAQRTGDDIDKSFNMREARGSLKLMEEEMGIHLPREMNTLIARIPGIGLAFEALLPILAAVFAVDMIYKYVEAQKKAQEALKKGWETASESLQTHSDELSVSIEKSKMLIDKLMKRPANGAALAIAEAKVEADKLSTSLLKDLDGLIKLMQAGAHGSIMTAILGTSGTGQAEDVAKGLRDELAKIPHDAKDFNEQAAQATINAWNRAQSEIKKNNDKAAAQAAAIAEKLAEGGNTSNLPKTDFTAANVALQEFQSHLSEVHNELDLVVKDEAFKKQAADLGTAVEQGKLYQKMFDAIAKSRAQLSKEIETLVEKDGKVTDEKLRIQLKAEEDANNLKLDALKKLMREENELIDEESSHAEEMAKLARAGEEQDAESQFKLRQITAARLLELKKQALNEEYEAEKAALERRLALLAALDPDDTAKLKKAQDKIIELTKKYQNELTALDTKAEDERAKHIIAAENRMAEAISRNMARSIVEGKDFGAAMRDLGKTLVEDALANTLKMIMIGDMKQAKDAGHAAASAFSWVMQDVPFPANAIIAPIAAAAAFVGVMAFEQGGIVPQTALAMVHQNEMVLPAGLAHGMQALISNGGAGSKDTHYHIDARGADAGVEQRIHRAIHEAEQRSVARAVSVVNDRAARSR